MNRREFFKLSFLFGAALALESNKGLKAIVDTLSASEEKVVLYLIQSKNGEWKVRWTTWVDMPKKNLSSLKVNLDTFKLLAIVNESEANDIRNSLWIQHNCKGQKGQPVNIKKVKAAGSAVAKHPNTDHRKPRVLSEEALEILRANGRKTGPILGKKNVESGLWAEISKRSGQRLKELFKQEDFRNRVIPKLAVSGKITATKNKQRGNLKSASEGGICAQGHINTNRKRWKQIMDQLPHEFTTSELVNLCSDKIQKNIVNRTDWVIRTDWGRYKKSPAFYDFAL
jgi:hypothetical protein